MGRQIQIAIVAFLVLSCSNNQSKKQPKTFYNTIAGWDIAYIPIIATYKATSLDKGTTWSLNRPEEVSGVAISTFGVSKNFIFGRGQGGWFLLDTKSKLFAEYATQEELIRSLKSFNVPINTVADCNSYFDSLTKGNTLYWFPKDGKTYPSYPNITPDNVTTINIRESANQTPHFSFEESLPFRKRKVYFFQVNYNKRDNDLYYLSFDNSQPVLVKDSLLIPVFSDKSQFDITLYTPYPVGQEKGIQEEKRFIKTKTAYIR